jgi:hypothetical protein
MSSKTSPPEERVCRERERREITDQIALGQVFDADDFVGHLLRTDRTSSDVHKVPFHFPELPNAQPHTKADDGKPKRKARL